MPPGALTRERDVREAYAAHSGELYGFALRSLNDAGLAEEAVQETFLRAWRAGERYDPQIGSLRTWLFAILRNVVIDLGRARAARDGALGAALFFGFTQELANYLSVVGSPVPNQFLNMLPYLATVVVLVLISRNATWIRANMPASLGKAFFPGS